MQIYIAQIFHIAKLYFLEGNINDYTNGKYKILVSEHMCLK